MKEKTISVGLDLSLTQTGVVVLEDGKPCKMVVVKSKPVDKTPSGEIARLLKIRKEISQVIDGYTPRIVLIEGLAFMAQNTTALAQLAALNYLIREKLFAFGIPFLIVAPSSLKKYVTGKGNAPKELMLMETLRHYEIPFIDNNLCDAYGLAKIGDHLISKAPAVKYQKEVLSILSPQLAAFDKNTR